MHFNSTDSLDYDSDVAKQQQITDKHSKLEQFLSLVKIAQRGSMFIELLYWL